MALDQVINIAQKHAKRSNEVGERSMSLGEHLEELRKRLFHAVLGVALVSGICFWFGKELVSYIADPMVFALVRNGFSPELTATEPSLGFGVYMKVGLIASVILAAPWILWQLWKFIAVGLYPSERKVVHILVPFSTVMAVMGAGFSYFIVLPVSADFFVNWSTSFPLHDQHHANPLTELLVKLGNNANIGGLESEHVDRMKPTLFDQQPFKLPVLKEDPKNPPAGMVWVNGDDGFLKIATADNYVLTVKASVQRMLNAMPSLAEWVDFAAFTTLGIVAIFQIPVLMLVLGWTRIVSPKTLADNRKYVIFGCAVIAAIVAPPDILSMIILGLPVYLLFEGGLLLMRWAYNKQQAAAEMDMEDDEGY